VIAGQVEAFGGLLTPSHRPSVILAPYSHHAVCLRALGEGNYEASSPIPQRTNSNTDDSNSSLTGGVGGNQSSTDVKEKIAILLSSIDTPQCAAIVLIESLDWNQKSESELNLYFPPKRIVEVMKTNDFYGHEEFDSSLSEEEGTFVSTKEMRKSNQEDEMAIEEARVSSQSSFTLSNSTSQLPLSRSDSGIVANETSALQLEKESSGAMEPSATAEPDDLEYFNPFGIPGLHLLATPTANSHYQTAVFSRRFFRMSQFSMTKLFPFLSGLYSFCPTFCAFDLCSNF
jgi:hypothetical protein